MVWASGNYSEIKSFGMLLSLNANIESHELSSSIRTFIANANYKTGSQNQSILLSRPRLAKMIKSLKKKMIIIS